MKTPPGMTITRICFLAATIAFACLGLDLFAAYFIGIVFGHIIGFNRGTGGWTDREH